MSPAKSPKPTARQNHYLTLGVDAFASIGVVKKAYRKLARQTHPDSPTGNEERFKAINTAYGVLSDNAQKVLYDAQLRRVLLDKPQPTQANKSNTRAKTTKTSTSNGSAATQKAKPPNEPLIDNAESFFDRFLKEPLRQGNPKTWPSIGETLHQWLKDDDSGEAKSSANSQARSKHSQRGEDVSVSLSLPVAEAAKGVQKTVHIKHKESCSRCHGTGALDGLSCRACHGEGFTIHTRKIEVTIPKNVKHGAKIRVAGEGGRGPTPGANGDLYLLVQLDPPPVSAGQSPPETTTTQPPEGLTVEGLNTHCEALVPFWEAMLGGSVTVETLHGPVSLTIPANTTSGKTLRLKGQGVHQGTAKGDHTVRVLVDLPKLNSAQIQRLEEWRPPK